MSKNYELLQQAEFALGSAPTFATGKSSVAAESVARAGEDALFVEPAIREEALKLVQRLFLNPDQAAPRSVLFAAVDASIGCNWLAAVTAKVLARIVSGSVCLVEGNFRSPSLPGMLGVDSDRGFVDALRQEGPLREFARQSVPDNLWVLPSGVPVPDSTVLLNSDPMKERFGQLRTEFDYVVVNAPSLVAFADGIILGRMVDGVVLVLEANATRREAAVRVTENLRAANIPVLGAVLNNRTFPIPAAVYKRF